MRFFNLTRLRGNRFVKNSTGGTTSGTNVGVGKGSSAGVKGMTTSQLQSGLPAGFDPAIWAETTGNNGGLPYLLANPPPK